MSRLLSALGILLFTASSVVAHSHAVFRGAEPPGPPDAVGRPERPLPPVPIQPPRPRPQEPSAPKDPQVPQGLPEQRTPPRN
jgi:hypothetical protein